MLKALLLIMTTFSVAIALTSENGIKEAPQFTLKSQLGKTVSLAELSNKIVVLEWINFDCPFIQKHYNSGKMQELQERFTKEGVVWLSICSSAKGKQGNFTTGEIKKRMQAHNAMPTAYLIDADGKVGQLYGAKTTPHMFIINKGTIVYSGAADSIRSTDVTDIPKAKNYIEAVLTQVLAGKSVSQESTAPYGCSVKY